MMQKILLIIIIYFAQIQEGNVGGVPAFESRVPLMEEETQLGGCGVFWQEA